ncbi:hypothetical protein JDV02_007983 [Purpureocillium takamizusanense]|uniref:Rhodanese domain-containing protein n=1 Tax=Purpureocillium takamizusanense TaxID=2060973 RepID=A0A9Q8QJA6_9HYPO|nr:uncharacterized protein JDV02_007983 [Purpureocillium takamizusanense]UNI22059.1 hypothetical protein JDV02_007983 [Purpureocillium takamizusanense]
MAAVPARRALARAARAVSGGMGGAPPVTARALAASVYAAAAARCATAKAVAPAAALRPFTCGSAVGRNKPWWRSESGDGEAGSEVPGSRLWSFEEVKRLVEEGKAADGDEPAESEGDRKSSSGQIVIVDVREPIELHETGKIPGAVNIPITSAVQSFHVSDADFQDMYGFERPPRDAHLLFYCKAGVRARSAAGLAQHAGWDSVGEYPGSWLDWEAKGGPVETVSTGEGNGKRNGKGGRPGTNHT